MLKLNRVRRLPSIRILKLRTGTGLLTRRPVYPSILLRFPPYEPERCRSFTNSTSSHNAADPGSHAESREMPPELWLTVLENTAKAPWLNLVSQEHEQKLKRAYTLLYQIVLYLGRPQEEGKAEQFLVAFESAIVPPDSEIGRARGAIATIIQAVVKNVSSVPISSVLRTEKSGIFNIFGALQALHDMHLVNGAGEAGEMENWAEFWSRAQPVVLALGMKLDEEGYGFDLDNSQKEQEREKDKGKENA